MPKPRVWTSESQIVKAIDRLRRKREKLIRWIERDEDEAKATLEISNGDSAAALYAQKLRTAATRRRGLIAAIDSATLPRLGRTLSAFRTQTMPGVVDGNQVVTQN